LDGTASRRIEVETTRTEPTPAKLPQELNEFLHELALALQRQGMYPGGHPSVDAAVDVVTRRLRDLLHDRAVLSLGIARRQIVVEGVATDSRQAVLRVLAERLHRHRLGAVALRRGMAAAELSDFLQAIAADPERSAPVGQSSPDQLGRWPHVGLYPITYEQLQLAGSEADEEQEREGSGSGTAAAQLWIGLAQAALARAEHGDGIGAEHAGDEPGATAADEVSAAADSAVAATTDENPDPVEVARAINEHHGASAYDQMIVGYMLQLANELRRDGASSGVKRRVSALIRELEPRTLQHLLHMGGDIGQRRRFLRDATDSFGASAMLDLVQAAAVTQQQDISTSMLRMLTKMSMLAEHGPGTVAEHADAELRAQVRELIEGWSLEDPNLQAYTSALQSMAQSPRSTGVQLDAVARPGSLPGGGAEHDGAPESITVHGVEPLRIVQMALEIGASGPVCQRAVGTLLSEARHAELFELLDLAEQEGRAAHLLWDHVGTSEHVLALLAAEHVDFDALDQMLVRMPVSGVLQLLLDALAASEARTTRMGLFVRIAAFGQSAVPHIVARLDDPRWYVVRNMLALLNEVGTWPESFSPLAYARHEQPMVRREALQLGARIPASRDAAISQAIQDGDERAMRAGINAAREGGLPPGALRVVLRRVDDASLAPELRASLVRLLDGQEATPVLDRLADLALRERRFRRPRLAPKSPPMLAALWVLAGVRTPQGRAAHALALARSDADPAVAHALRRQ
jgi:hypothetical protein